MPPIPKRSTQRRRTNSPATDIIVVDDEVRGPALKGAHSAVGKRWYEALRRSGQAVFFQPSDWAAAELVVIAIDAYVKKPTAFMLTALNAAQTPLLVTEGDRRRLRVELERAEPSEEEADVSELARYRERAGGAA